ncbi:MAG: hypothetical protein PVS2B2_26940 [Candidatus Acidiferrum sp.]
MATVIIFACPGCGACYRADQHFVEAAKADQFTCPVCDAVVHRWEGRYAYYAWKRETTSAARRRN